MSIDHSAVALQAALRAFGETLGRALSEGIAQGLQEGLSHSLDLDHLVEGAPARTVAATGATPRRGGRPRGEARPCRVTGCGDPARSRGLCSRHYQQELRREKAAQAGEAAPAAAAMTPVEARPPIVRKRPEMTDGVEFGAAVQAPAPAAPEPVLRDEIRSPTDAAKRIFG